MPSLIRMIYLATPYSHPDAAVREARFHNACTIAGKLISSGLPVFCPIAHTHPIAIAEELPLGFDYWSMFDRFFIEACDGVYVVRMPGWLESKGIRWEIEMARKLGKEVDFLGVDEYGNPLSLKCEQEHHEHCTWHHCACPCHNHNKEKELKNANSDRDGKTNRIRDSETCSGR